jgi:hypothetical protein
MICSRPTAPRFALRSGIDRCGNPNARVRTDVPSTEGLIVVLCDGCAAFLRLRARIERRRRRSRLAIVTLCFALLASCLPQATAPHVVDAQDYRCVVVRDEHGASYCFTAAELRTLVPLMLADRRAHVNDVNQPGF